MASTSNPRFREKNFFKAQLANEAGRSDHAVQFMMEIAKSVTPWAELSLYERKFLSTTIKKFLNELRRSWNHIYSKMPGLAGVESDLAQLYLNKIAEEIANFCGDAKLFINQGLVISARSAEARVFYLTLNADLSCYLVDTEGDQGDQKEGAAAILDYKKAKEIAKKELSWLSPARLTLALHMSEFYSDVMEMQEKGMKVASKALDNAVKARSQLLIVEEGFTEEINELLTKLNARVAPLPMYYVDKRAGSSMTHRTFSYTTGKEAGTTENMSALQPELLETMLRRTFESGEDNCSEYSYDKIAGPSTNQALQPELLEPILRPPFEHGEKTATSEIKNQQDLENSVKTYSELLRPEEAKKVNELFELASSDNTYVEQQDAEEAFCTQLTSKTATEPGTSETNVALQPEPLEEALMSKTSVPRPIDADEDAATTETNSETKAAMEHEPLEEAGISEPGNCPAPPPPSPDI